MIGVAISMNGGPGTVWGPRAGGLPGVQGVLSNGSPASAGPA